ncbi:hypothetical protein GGI08_000198, partial [Coemansia sp. S2]
MFIYEIAKGEDWKTTAKLQIEAIWSIVEGQPQPERGRAVSSGEYELAIPSDWQVVTKQRHIQLPDALFEQYDLLECRCFMGLFPEIKRAWITVDHRLFLWNYEDESDFYSFEDQEQIIVSVAL